MHEGVALFDSIQFFGIPESEGNLFSITTKTVDPKMIKKFFGNNYYDSIKGELDISFR